MLFEKKLKFLFLNSISKTYIGVHRCVPERGSGGRNRELAFSLTKLSQTKRVSSYKEGRSDQTSHTISASILL